MGFVHLKSIKYAHGGMVSRGGSSDVEEVRQVWRMWMDLNENKRILRLYRD